MNSTQIAIVGAGPAGLQAAMSVGRVHREAVVFDSGEYRNAPVTEMHNVIGSDGENPATFRAAAREQLARYETVQMRRNAVTRVSRTAEGFVLEAEGGPLLAQAVILATGMRDVLPDIPGLAELWGQQAGQCPFCHGHEFTGRRVALLGAQEAGHYAAMLHPVTSDLVALADAQPVPDDVSAVLEAYSTPVRHEKVSGIEQHGDHLVVHFEGGEDLAVAGVFLLPGMQQRAPFAEQLGLATHDSGAVVVDEWQRTSVEGVFAAGDMAHTTAFAVPMASVVQGMGSGQMAAISAIQSLMAASPNQR